MEEVVISIFGLRIDVASSMPRDYQFYLEGYRQAEAEGRALEYNCNPDTFKVTA